MLIQEVQFKQKSKEFIRDLGIIILPPSPFTFKERPFYLKKICGLSPLERNINNLKKEGLEEVIVFTKNGLDKKIIDEILTKEDFETLITLSTLEELKKEIQKTQPKSLVLLDGSMIIDDRIIKELKTHEEVVIVRGDNIKTNRDDQEREKPLIARVKPEYILNLEDSDLASYKKLINTLISRNSLPTAKTDEIKTYKPGMRRDVPLHLYLFKEPDDFKSAKKLMVKSTQKGTLDLVAWYFNRHFENFFVYLLSETPITANHVTYLVNVLGYITMFLFITQNWWIGIVMLILINIFDGVDGKLARLRMKESKVGHIEHSFDQLYEQAIYVGAGLGAFFIIGEFYVIIVILIMLLADSFNRHCSMQYKEVMKISLADSSRFDQMFRRFDGRRNIYTIHLIVFGLFGYFEFSIFSMCLHAIITGIVYSIQAIRHMKKADLK